MVEKCKKCGRENIHAWDIGSTCEHCIRRDLFQEEKWALRRETLGKILFIALIILLIYISFFEK